MNLNIELDRKNTLMMKLIHYLMVEKNYNPIIIQGADNEIWLENLTSDYQIVRIVSNHIINDEQLDYDIFKTKRITRKIKLKTFTFKMRVLNIYVDLDEDLKLENLKDMDMVSLTEDKDINKYKFIYDSFPDINNKLKFTEKGFQLFAKITDDINKHNMDTSEKVEEIFKPKKPIITVFLIALNVMIFMITNVLGIADDISAQYAVNGHDILVNHEFYRLITGAFLHVDFLHLLFNMYALFILGKQIESMMGKLKFTTIYFYSMLGASLLSIILNRNPSVGASGAIFGLMGSILYFGYYYRVYLGQIVRTQIVPIILINLVIGFLPGSNIDNYAHIGGLIGGFFITMATGIKYKSDKFEKTNGIIVSILYIVLLVVIAIKFVSY